MAGSPPSTAPSLAVVPPMSKVSTRSKPSSLPMAPLSSTPAAGPDSTMRIGMSQARSADTSPPFDCMMKRSEAMPCCFRAPASRLT